MDRRPRPTTGGSRLVAAAGILALSWIIVYWLTPSVGAPTDEAGFAPDPLDRTPPITLVDDAGRPANAPLQPEVAQAPPAAPPETGSDAETEQQASPPPARVIPPQFRDHVVARNETMQTIARDVYGSSSRWTVIARANPSVDPMRLRVGQTLRLPLDPENIQGRVEGQAPAPGEPDLTEVVYVVKRGDTLGAISSSVYGSSRHWRLILDANSDKVSRAEQIRPGMELVIPPLPAGND